MKKLLQLPLVTAALITCLGATSTSASTTTTTAVRSKRRAQQHQQQNRGLGIEIEENGISFDGSLSDLFEIAYEKKEGAKTPAPSPSPVRGGVNPDNTPAPVPDEITMTAAPVTAAPVTIAPVTIAPVTIASVTVAPVTIAPVAVAPVAVAATASPVIATTSPVTLSPVTMFPVTVSPVTASPVTSAPFMTSSVTASPVTVSPVTTPPVTNAPVVVSVAPGTAAPITSAPVLAPVAAPATEAPVDEVIDPNTGGQGSPDTFSISCNRQFESVDSITYRFALEYETEYDVEKILPNLEKNMNTYIADRLLPCATGGAAARPTNDRRALQQEVGLVAIDSRDPDSVATTAFCASTFDTNTCRVVDGSMRIFVGLGEDADFAHFKVRVEIRNYLNSINTIAGLYATTYLSPEILNPSEVNAGTPGGNAPRFQATANTTVLTNRSIILFAFAGVAFIGSVGIAVWFRRTHERRSNSSNNMNNSVNEIKDTPPDLPYLNTTDTASDADEPLSPFSQMLPAAYRLDDGEADMSVILELSERGSSSGRHSSILLSEGGYSTDDGESLDFDLSGLNFSYNSAAPVLGAKRRSEEQSLVHV